MTIAQMKSAVAKWVEYRRTRAELARLDIDTALDIEILPRDADRVARKAVYGA